MFWIALGLLIGSLGGLLYIYVGYPLLIAARAHWRPRPYRCVPFTGQVSVVLAAHNEAGVLPRKLASVLAGTNADQIGEIWIGSDGSTDDTVAVVKALADPRIRVEAFPVRRGKLAVLNALIPRCQHEVVVLTDARQEWAPDALDRLLAPMADDEVGVVSGEMVFRDPARPSATALGMDAYWRYEKFIRQAESRCHSVPGATGALYALRRACFRPLPEDLLLDDVAIPLEAVRQGYRCGWAAGAEVYDQPSQTRQAENLRKRRTIAGTIQLIRRFPWLLNPRSNPIWFSFNSHKTARLLSPGLLVLAAVSNGWLVWLAPAILPFGVLLVGQAAFYLWALLGFIVPGRTRGWAAGALFLQLNGITCQAWLDAWRKRYTVTWRRPDAVSNSNYGPNRSGNAPE